MDSGLVMMLKSFGIEKLIGQVVSENLPRIEALANDLKQQIENYKAHVDARFDTLEQMLQGESPAGVGQTQKDFEANLGKLEVTGHLLGVYSDGE